MLDEYEENSEQQVREAVAAAEALGEKAIFSVQPGVQANCNLLSRESFEEFAWPSYKRMADFILKNGGYVHFHMDSNWTNVLDYFTDFPKGRCIFDTDGFTDLYKVRDLLGGKMAFTGSVAPATMASYSGRQLSGGKRTDSRNGRQFHRGPFLLTSGQYAKGKY